MCALFDTSAFSSGFMSTGCDQRKHYGEHIGGMVLACAVSKVLDQSELWRKRQIGREREGERARLSESAVSAEAQLPSAVHLCCGPRGAEHWIIASSWACKCNLLNKPQIYTCKQTHPHTESSLIAGETSLKLVDITGPSQDQWNYSHIMQKLFFFFCTFYN